MQLKKPTLRGLSRVSTSLTGPQHLFSYCVCARWPPHKWLQSEAPELRSFATQNKPHRYAIPSLLKNSAILSDLNCGRTLHAAAIRMGLQSELYISSALINMYAKCGSLGDAVQVFVGLPEKDATTWNSMVDGFFRHGCRQEGFSCFLQMQFSGVRPDGYSLSILLSACSDYTDLEHGRQIHAHLVRNILGRDSFLGTTLIDMYVKCGQVTPAQKVFDTMKDKNVYVWNAMIGGFWQIGLWEKSVELFADLKSQDIEVGSATLSSVLTACSYGEALDFGEMIHSDVIKIGFELDPYVCTSLLTMYGKCASVESAVKVFVGVPDKRIELCNSMISAYSGTGFPEESLHVYTDMHCFNAKPDSFTFSNVLAACAMINRHDFGRAIHGQLIKRPDLSNFMVLSSLMTLYMKSGNTEDASAVFDSIEEKDVVVWGSMIIGFCQNTKLEDALGLVKQMQIQGLKPDSAIVASIACTCVRSEYIELGYQIHGYAIKSGMELDAFVGSVLIDMYAKSGLLESAEKVFSNIPHKNLVAWNSMVSGFSRNGEIDSCISTFAQIRQVGLMPDSISVTSVLVAVSLSSALLKGKMIHGYNIRSEIDCDAHVDNALLDMYTKCGCLRYAQHIFERMPVRTTVSWNSMISGYGSHGHCNKAIGLFEEMQRSKVAPDEITFLALVSSCSHSGLTEEGFKFFCLMTRSYGILPTMEHYANVVDLLGRAGHINEAYCFVLNLPVEADTRVWLCLLSACRAHGNLEIGKIAADHLLRLEPVRGASHIQLWNFYGEGRLLEKAATVRIKMRTDGLKKMPGCSWIEVRNKAQVFFSGDASSPSTLNIHDVLSRLRRNLRDDNISL